MVRDAELNAEADKTQRELIEARNTAEGTLHNFKDDVEKYSSQITEEEKANVEDAIKAVEDAIKGDDIKIIQESIPKLYEAMGPITSKKHEEEEKAKAASSNDKKSSEDNIVDAEAKETI